MPKNASPFDGRSRFSHFRRHLVNVSGKMPDHSMNLRVSGLLELDPLSVPLPSGTEVSTRVDRNTEDRRIPQGAIGRVFALPFNWTIGLRPPPEDLVSEDASANYWEVRKLVRQALRGDPNTLEMLFLSSARALDPIGQWILDEKTAFASREIYASFGRY